MARRWLADGELEVITLRPHASSIWFPIVMLLLLALGLGAGLRAIAELVPELRWVLVGLVCVFGFVFVFRPLLRWRNTRYVLTTRRLLTRIGAFGRIVHDIPLAAISQVECRRGATGWLTGCGNLRIVTVDGFWLDLRKVPDVKRVRNAIHELGAESYARPLPPPHAAWATA
ncbi:PH domain-containing protein [Naumannella halotolerans]|uniref:PH (Pleckstrin Homology) domain-containing protein n=1 Tax=Naumannella halotolerans TaxID=993414 RepID=A0A4R7JCE2_9ACTN|nr:PH domain-containing protein [Naumannella halotolerans]TDT34119.1 PH (Pleckstrin Homology) domain-containing protein [Naumannella halotolerans]